MLDEKPFRNFTELRRTVSVQRARARLPVNGVEVAVKLGGGAAGGKTFAPLYRRLKFARWVGRRAKLSDRAHCRPEVVRTRRDGVAVPTRQPGATAVSRALRARPPDPPKTLYYSYY